MDKEIIVDGIKYVRNNEFIFYGIDYWNRVIMYNKEKDIYLKTIALDSDVLNNLEKKEIHSLYTIAAYDEDFIEGEPDRPTIFKVFPEQIGDNINIVAYKKGEKI